jgi:hypothetical protein
VVQRLAGAGNVWSVLRDCAYHPIQSSLIRKANLALVIDMGSRKGIKNKRTLMREANMREAAARAQLILEGSDDESIKADSLVVMEEAMTFFHRLALKERGRKDADIEMIRDNYREAVAIAKDVAPYRYPRLSTVKVGGDRINIPFVPDGVTAEQVKAELFSEIVRTGILPTIFAKFLPGSEGVFEAQRLVGGGNTSRER